LHGEAWIISLNSQIEGNAQEWQRLDSDVQTIEWEPARKNKSRSKIQKNLVWAWFEIHILQVSTIALKRPFHFGKKPTSSLHAKRSEHF
jgi:hypothetical protein